MSAQHDERRCPDCGCPEHVMLQDGFPCCEAEYERAINPEPPDTDTSTATGCGSLLSYCRCTRCEAERTAR